MAAEVFGAYTEICGDVLHIDALEHIGDALLQLLQTRPGRTAGERYGFLKMIESQGLHKGPDIFLPFNAARQEMGMLFDVEGIDDRRLQGNDVEERRALHIHPPPILLHVVNEFVGVGGFVVSRYSKLVYTKIYLCHLCLHTLFGASFSLENSHIAPNNISSLLYFKSKTCILMQEPFVHFLWRIS